MSSKRIVDLRSAKPLQRLRFFRAPEKRPSLRDRRRKIRFVALGATIAVCATIAWGIHAFSYLPQLSVQRIEVRGASKVSPSRLSEYAANILDEEGFHYISRRNIFEVPKRAITEAILEQFPRVASVALSREAYFSTTLIITVTEREPFARWCIDLSDPITSCFFLDASGFIFADSTDLSEVPKSPYLFSGGSRNVDAIGRTFAEGDFARALELLSALSDDGHTPLSAEQTEEDFVVALAQGFDLKVSRTSDPHDLVRNLELVLSSDTLRGKESQLEYIDLRFGNRVYYKLKGQVESPAE